MNKIVRSVAALGLVIVTSLSVFSGVARAQDATPNESITLSPAVFRPSFDAGQRAGGTITVINDGKTDYNFLLYARPFSVTDENYDPNYTEVNERSEAYQWIQFNQTQFRLKAGQRVEVGYTVQVPNNASSGGHYGVIFAETQPPQGNGVNVVRKKRVGSLLYMTVNGTINQAGSLESWDTILWQKKPPLVSYVRVKNTGNVHFQADLSASYANLFGKKQFTLNQQVLILPGTTRKIPVRWEHPPYLGIFKVGGRISYLGKTDILQTKYVILLPTKVLIIFLAIVALTVLIYVLNKRRVKRRPQGGRRR